MCGIFATLISGENAPQKVFDGLKDIEYRGYDSWGVAWYKKGKVEIFKDTGFLPTKFTLPSSKLSLGHTRWATHGGVTKKNAHPHTDCSGKITLVHNGIVENYISLKNSLGKHHFVSDTDSEIIAHAIEEQIKKTPDLSEAVARVFEKLEGLNAIVVTDGVEIVAVKKGSPLVIGKLENGYALCSDPNALLPQTQSLLFMEDNQLCRISRSFYLYSLSPYSEISAQFSSVSWKYARSDMSTYPHFMIKEIEEQPRIINHSLSQINNLEKVADMIKSSYGTYFIACGTASYASLVGTYLFSKYAQKHVNFSIGSEFVYLQNFLTSQSLVIAVSQSGESIDTLEPVIAAKNKGAKVVALVNVEGSSLYRSADFPILLHAGVEKAVASTKAMSAMVAYLIILSLLLNNQKDQAIEIIKKSSASSAAVIKKQKLIRSLAAKIYKSNNIYVIGRGLSYPVALEAALKIKEVSYIHAEGFAGGELKHGPIALIEKHTPVIVFVPDDETYESSISNAMEVKSRGAFVIGVGFKNNPVFDAFFEVADTGAGSIIPHIIFAQLLAYYLTIKKGLNPDKPRNLAKSVVVR